MKKPTYFLLATSLALTSADLSIGATVSLPPSKDTSLMEVVPNNNTGTMGNLVSGSIANGKRTRALVQFDTLNQIPADATILSVSLQLSVLKSPPLPVAPGSSFHLHRILVDWKEGTKGVSNTGDRATDEEPTWSMRSFNVSDWEEPGGSRTDTDFAAAASGSAFLDAPGAYTFVSTPEMVADVQMWVCDPSSNHGWAIISGSEGTAATARRLGSKETGGPQVPSLLVEYGPANPEVRITGLEAQGDSVRLVWSGGQPPYQVQQLSGLDDDWTPVRLNVGCERNVQLPVDRGVAFFRVVSGGPQ